MKMELGVEIQFIFWMEIMRIFSVLSADDNRKTWPNVQVIRDVCILEAE